MAIDEHVKAINYMSGNAQDPPAVRKSRQDNLDLFKRPFREGGIRKYYQAQIERSRENNATLNNPNRHYGDAVYFALLGDKENALDALERAFDVRAFQMAWVKADPMFDSLRGEPRFKAILQTMNLPPDN